VTLGPALVQALAAASACPGRPSGLQASSLHHRPSPSPRGPWTGAWAFPSRV